MDNLFGDADDISSASEGEGEGGDNSQRQMDDQVKVTIEKCKGQLKIGSQRILNIQ